VYEIEIWVDVEFFDGVSFITACTLFANQTTPMRPMARETLSYMQDRRTALTFREFYLRTPIGSQKSHSVGLQIDYVSHYSVNTNEGILQRTSVRCDPIKAETLEDAKSVCTFMIEHFNFEFDPYANNLLLAENDKTPNH
jgi:hypothetical protein